MSSELGAFRLASLRRGRQVSESFEALAFRYIQNRIVRDFQNRHSSKDPQTAVLAHSNWVRFSDWVLSPERTDAERVKYLGQNDPLRRTEMTNELERDVVQHDGLVYLWSFGKQP